MKTYWIYDGCWKRVTPERYLAYDGIKEIRDREFGNAETDAEKNCLRNGGFVPYEEYRRPDVDELNIEDLNVFRSMLKHGIMPDKKEMDRIAEAIANALRNNPEPVVKTCGQKEKTT